MKKLLLLSSAFCLGFAGNSHAVVSGGNNVHTDKPAKIVLVSSEQQLQKAQSFVTKVADQGIGFLSNEDLSQTQRIAAFKKLLKNNFDMKTIGRFALGRYWRGASKAQQKEYLELFEQMVVNVYADRFGEYKGEKLAVKSARPEGKKDILVTSSVKGETGGEVQVDWRLRDRNGSFKVIDVIVEGVSMSLTQRSDFASVIQRGGGDVEMLLAHLRK